MEMCIHRYLFSQSLIDQQQNKQQTIKPAKKSVTFQRCCYKLAGIDVLRVWCIRQHLKRKQTNVKKQKSRNDTICVAK